MKSAHIAIPYAKALFEIAMENNALEETMQDMTLIRDVCHSSRDFVLMLKSPVVTTEKKTKIVHSVFDGKLSKITLTYFLIILRKRREPIIPDIAHEFVEIYKDYKGILTTYLKTTEQVPEDIRKKVIEALGQQTGKTIDLIEETDDRLIGGFVLRWKDMQYDASILNQINKLKKEVESINLYVKGY